jgi:hypothetical protein
MKLNLLPTYVSKEKATRSALLLGILIFVVCVVASVFLSTKAYGDLSASQQDIGRLRGDAEKAKKTAEYADTVMERAKPLLRNAGLAKAMIDHNQVYPALYDEVKRYIPSFYRVNSMSAAASGPTSATVTLVGVIDSYQQYADLMLALLRMPKVQSISRSGFTNTNAYVPSLTPEDQTGKKRKPGEAPIPDDPLKRLEYFQSQGRLLGYQGVGGFGSGDPGIRGPMPNASLVTVTLVLDRNLQAPDPASTLAAGSTDAIATGPGPNAAGGSTPASTPPSTTASAPAPPPSSAPTSGRKGRGIKGGETGEGD